MNHKQEIPEKIVPAGCESWDENLEHRIKHSQFKANIFSMAIILLGVCVGIGVHRLLPLDEVSIYIALEDTKQGNHQLIEETITEYEQDQNVKLKLLQDQTVPKKTEQ